MTAETVWTLHCMFFYSLDQNTPITKEDTPDYLNRFFANMAELTRPEINNPVDFDRNYYVNIDLGTM